MKQHKLPTIAGLVLLIFGVIAGVFLTQKDAIFRLAASPDETPQDIRTTNVGGKSFTVSWLTDKPTVGFVSWGKSASLGTVANQQVSPQLPKIIHYVTVDNLTPATTYFFKVGSGKNLFDDDGQPYQVKTAKEIGLPATSDVIFGSVLTSAQTPASGAIVYITLAGASPISALTDSKGGWSIPLSTTRNTSLSSYVSYSKERTILNIFATAGGGQTGTARILAGSAKPVPPITIGKTHDFTDIKPVDSGGVPTADIILPEATTPPPSGFATEQVTTTGKTVSVTLATPKDKESLSLAKPILTGTGTPGTVVSILLESTTYSATLTIGQAGTWTWTPPENLATGLHTLTLSWKDETGGTKKLTSSFTVLAGAAGGPVATATPTASPKPSPSPTPKATASASPSLPVSGNLTATLGLLIMGIVFVLIGLLLPKVTARPS